MFLDLNVFQKQLSIPRPSKRFDILLHTGHPLAGEGLSCSTSLWLIKDWHAIDEGKRHHTSRHGASWMFLLPGVGGKTEKSHGGNQVVQFFRGPFRAAKGVPAFSIWQSLRDRRMETVETGSLD